MTQISMQDKQSLGVCFAGYCEVDGARVEVEFEVPVGASQEQIDAAFLGALAQKATIDYLAIGEAR
ncbi:hypothetical protein CBP36_21050 (plasmid) [Acidovorax carolinensis]|uniref:Uncharacterized protein n=1 Tax=Acidovorax carolinensis TaxID=553814 RepID=A0A240UJ08_9BURK|nr:hypothetical protein [Acidovorax carolinensis]ART61458.1 hypothetical protein CBP36_21050 [Acidovorax carolinensis]